jgi:hypothetical protein
VLVRLEVTNITTFHFVADDLLGFDDEKVSCISKLSLGETIDDAGPSTLSLKLLEEGPSRQSAFHTTPACGTVVYVSIIIMMCSLCDSSYICGCRITLIII